MTIDLARFIEYVFWASMGIGGAVVLNYFVGRKWLIGLFESEGEPSVRIVTAVGIVIFTLIGQQGQWLSEGMVEANYFMAGTLFGLGTTKLIATRFAARPPVPDTQIKAGTAPVNADTVNLSTNGNTSA